MMFSYHNISVILFLSQDDIVSEIKTVYTEFFYINKFHLLKSSIIELENE